MDLGRLSLGITTFFLTVIEALLAFRLALKLLAADSSATFTSFVYANTDPLVVPFEGVFPSFEVLNFTLELSTVLAMIVYGVVGIVILSLLRHFVGVRVKVPNQPSGPIYQQDPNNYPQPQNPPQNNGYPPQSPNPMNPPSNQMGQSSQQMPTQQPSQPPHNPNQHNQ